MRKRLHAMPAEECVDRIVELIRILTMHIQVAGKAPAQERIRVVVSQPHRAAARQNGEHHESDACASGAAHQKLSTVIWPGARRRCFRSPRSARTAVASFSMSGLPQRSTWEVCGLKVRPAA